MLLAKVIGNVVATQKNQRYEGARVMLCRQITPEGEDMENTLLALDSVVGGRRRHGFNRAGRLGRVDRRDRNGRARRLIRRLSAWSITLICCRTKKSRKARSKRFTDS
ncbi:MAG: EutN/CcmL family microcompartment protein [Pyrinomonadaceae bacterium]